MRVIQIPVPMIRVQVKVHPRKKRRLQKKWATRYGYRLIIDPKADLDSVLIDKRNDVVYCYPHQYEAIRARFTEMVRRPDTNSMFPSQPIRTMADYSEFKASLVKSFSLPLAPSHLTVTSLSFLWRFESDESKEPVS